MDEITGSCRCRAPKWGRAVDALSRTRASTFKDVHFHILEELENLVPSLPYHTPGCAAGLLRQPKRNFSLLLHCVAQILQSSSGLRMFLVAIIFSCKIFLHLRGWCDHRTNRDLRPIAESRSRQIIFSEVAVVFEKVLLSRTQHWEGGTVNACVIPGIRG